MSKTADLLILRPVSQDSPGSVSTGETPRQKMSKVVAPRDTKPDSGRESTKSNLSSARGPDRERVRRRYRSKPDNHRISSERKSGQAFLDHEIFTKSHRLDFHSGKTVDQPAPRREPRDSPRTASKGETPLEKMGGGTDIILAVQKCLSGVLCSFD